MRLPLAFLGACLMAVALFGLMPQCRRPCQSLHAGRHGHGQDADRHQAFQEESSAPRLS